MSLILRTSKLLKNYMFVFSHYSFTKNRLCTELQTLIQERAEIEKGYAKSLKMWAKKWSELIEKGKLFCI